MNLDRDRPAVEVLGDRAVIVTCAGTVDRMHVAAGLRASLPGMLVRSGMSTVLVEQPEPDANLLLMVSEAVATLADASIDVVDHRPDIVIPVRYDGQDLADVARLLGLSVDDVVAAHLAQTWRVAMMGFAPGFGYLMPDDAPQARWTEVSRRTTPRVMVPAGSVAVAAGMSAVYPAAMPGGWHLIGTTQEHLFDPEDPVHPALLDEGAVVRFIQGSS